MFIRTLRYSISSSMDVILYSRFDCVFFMFRCRFKPLPYDVPVDFMSNL